ncbi:unnamed protein product [Closterium sp. NIES-54]
MAAAKRVLRYLCSTLSMGLVLGGRRPVVLTGHADTSWADDQATQRSSQGYSFSLGSGSVSWRSTRSSFVLGSSCEAEIYAGAMAAQELRWLTYLLTDLGEAPRSPPVLLCGDFVIHPELALLCLTVLVTSCFPTSALPHAFAPALSCALPHTRPTRCPRRYPRAQLPAPCALFCPRPTRPAARAPCIPRAPLLPTSPCCPRAPCCQRALQPRAPHVLLPVRPAACVRLYWPRRLLPARALLPAHPAALCPAARAPFCPRPACAAAHARLLPARPGACVACCPRAPCCPRALMLALPATRAPYMSCNPRALAARALCSQRCLLVARALHLASPAIRARPAASAPCCQRALLPPRPAARAPCCPCSLLLACALLPTRPAASARPAARAPWCLHEPYCPARVPSHCRYSDYRYCYSCSRRSRYCRPCTTATDCHYLSWPLSPS